jgi:CRISPR-associated exonuclease Cas4
MIEVFLLLIILLALGAALVARWRARELRAQSGLPINARVIYADTGAWRKVEKPLYSRRYQLAGKPDYIVEDENGGMIPIEVKPNRVAAEPRLSDTLQLAAYGLLVEENFGASPSYGLLKYRDQVFRVEFTNKLREELLAVMEEMRRDLNAADVARSHDDPRRCRACGYRHACGQALSE